MNQTIPTQHPAVVLRSHYLALRRLLAIAAIAIVGLTVAVVLLAATTNGSARTATPSVRVSPPAASTASGARFDRQGTNDVTSGSPGNRASATSCGDVCSSYRGASTTVTPPTRASATSCGDVCSSYRQEQ
jgi:hypothetical protein